MNPSRPALAIPKERFGDDPDFATIVDLLARKAEKLGDRELLRFEEGSWSYRQFDELTSQVAHHLIGIGVQPGERVAIMLPNIVHWPVSWVAIHKAGAVAVPVNSSYLESDLEFVLRDSGTVVVLTDAERRDLVETVLRAESFDADVDIIDVVDLDVSAMPTDCPDVPLSGDSLANLQYTSGTTGFPKACMLTQEHWVRQAWLVGCVCEAAEDDVVLTAQPFSYVDPQWNLVMTMLAEATLVVLPRFSASGFFRDVRKHGVTMFYVLGSMPALLYKQPPSPADRENDLRLVMCSGIPTALHAALEDRWDAPWREGYGMTETGVDLVAFAEEDHTVGTGAIGQPVPTKQIRIVNEDEEDVPDGSPGELIVSGKPMMLGYWNRPDATAETIHGGWLHTGDLVIREPDSGQLQLIGRIKDMVRRGGENISCAEVEQVLMRSDLVTECAVIAVPDDLFGEEVKAFVQLAEGHRPGREAAESIIEQVRSQLARFKVPRFVEFVDSFPKTPSERIAKSVLKERTASSPGESYDLGKERTHRTRAGQSPTESAESR